MLRWVWLSILVVILDQASKIWMETNFTYQEQFVVIDNFFNLTLAYNTGAAFSFLANAGGWQRWFFSLLAVVISIILITWMQRLASHERWAAIGLALVLGGAVGNLVDRLIHGHVIDFLLFYYQQWSWPAFNVADMAITIGVSILLLDALFDKRHE